MAIGGDDLAHRLTVLRRDTERLCLASGEVIRAQAESFAGRLLRRCRPPRSASVGDEHD
jgi:hypothetical protein